MPLVSLVTFSLKPQLIVHVITENAVSKILVVCVVLHLA
jgi:hypothetical protein